MAYIIACHLTALHAPLKTLRQCIGLLIIVPVEAAALDRSWFVTIR